MRRALILAVAAVLVAAGCTGGEGAATTTEAVSTTGATPTTTAATTTTAPSTTTTTLPPTTTTTAPPPPAIAWGQPAGLLAIPLGMWADQGDLRGGRIDVIASWSGSVLLLTGVDVYGRSQNLGGVLQTDGGVPIGALPKSDQYMDEVAKGAGKFKKMSFIPLLLPSYRIFLLVCISPVPDEI